MKKTILIIEDDEFIRGAITSLLELEGYAVRAADNGEEGLHVLAHSPAPSVILLDMEMPIMGGREFLDVVGGDSSLKKIPVVVVSASANEHQVKHLGAKACIRKCSDLSKLLNTVGQLCNHRAYDNARI